MVETTMWPMPIVVMKPELELVICDGGKLGKHRRKHIRAEWFE
jgi:hypothetical protein